MLMALDREEREKLSHAQPFLLPSWVLLRMVVTAQAALQAAGGPQARACVRLFSSFCNAEQSMPGFQRCLLIPTLPRASALDTDLFIMESGPWAQCWLGSW